MPRSWMLSIASGFLSNSFLGEIPDLLGLQPLHGCGIVGSICQSPCSRHRCARRQHEVIEDVTAHAVNIAGSQVFIKSQPHRSCFADSEDLWLVNLHTPLARAGDFAEF